MLEQILKQLENGTINWFGAKILIEDLYKNNGDLGNVSETLLIKYIDHVGQCEGVDFIDKCNHYSSEVKFTDKEIEHLERLR